MKTLTFTAQSINRQPVMVADVNTNIIVAIQFSVNEGYYIQFYIKSNNVSLGSLNYEFKKQIFDTPQLAEDYALGVINDPDTLKTIIQHGEYLEIQLNDTPVIDSKVPAIDSELYVKQTKINQIVSVLSEFNDQQLDQVFAYINQLPI